MSEKKVVGRSVAIGIGIICILLAVGLVGVIANYTLMINRKDNTIASKNSQISSLNYQVDNLNNIVNLAESTVWKNDVTVSQPASYYTYWTPAFSASYAGYVSVWVHTSTTTNTYVRVIYTAYGVNYDQQIGVGTGGTAVFPLLLCLNIDIRVGNTNLVNGATETVTITYHY